MSDEKPELKRPEDPSDMNIIITDMWWEIAAASRSHALEAAELGSTSKALRYGELAEASFWKATGETDCIDIKSGTIWYHNREGKVEKDE